MAAPSFYSDPHVQFLSQLLEEIEGGHLQVPRFQRPLVWDWDQRKELLASIRDGIPIGAIMVWRTTGDAIKCYEFLGPHQLAQPPANATRQYLLDGVQRLSTLYGALHPMDTTGEPSAKSAVDVDEDDFGEDVRNFEVFYDLETKEFLTSEENDALGDLFGARMPLNLVFDSVALLRFQRSLHGISTDAAVSASDEIARAFREYKIPIIPITTDDLDLATRTFQRINSQGTQMSELHMVHALTWSADFDLQQHIAKIRREVLDAKGWIELDDDPILKTCKAALDLELYRTDAQDLSRQLRTKANVLDEVGIALGNAADFLWQDCGVRTPDLVPYALQIVFLAESFRLKPNPGANLRRILRAWFWVTTYGELFTGMSGDRAQSALTDMRFMVLAEEPTWTWNRPFVERSLRAKFDFRTARAKALAFRLAQRKDEVNQDRSGTMLLADVGRRAVAQVLPWNQTKGAVFASPANRFLIHPGEIANFRDRLLVAGLPEHLAKEHFVTPEAAEALQKRDFPLFIAARVAALAEFESQFITPLVDLFGVEARLGEK